MSVEVKNLVKVYGEQRAVDNISFKAKQGEVLGFLGPNGAGKSTTMKIITGFIPQSEGSTTVCGFNTAASPLEVQKRIGYLPERNPLYKDMYVKEYLTFVANLHKVSNKKSRVAEMIEMTGLEREQNKIIDSLSKGYKQRVGLAQAMLHNPDVLILDEPTSGLDPNQLVEIRALIKKIGQEKTVIFSTHIMQEVQAICDRVVIINKGKLVANDSIEKLQDRVTGGNLITVEFAQNVNKSQLSKIEGVKSVKALEDNKWELLSNKKVDVRSKVFHFAVQNKLTLLEMRRETYSIENVFQELTK
ncbi:MAG: gliding motility-associated ABC transporter ATP-binding subunit GldA [Saprospiraceae bacterium]|jgi:ABC-2 type transport system ATP-binding protein